MDHGLGDMVLRKADVVKGDEGAGGPKGVLCVPGDGMAAENFESEGIQSQGPGAKCWWSC